MQPESVDTGLWSLTTSFKNRFFFLYALAVLFVFFGFSYKMQPESVDTGLWSLTTSFKNRFFFLYALAVLFVFFFFFLFFLQDAA
jgi:hypothetical protein